MEKVFYYAAFVSIFVAALCLLFNYPDAAFVVGVLGCLSWFLSYRAKIKKPEQS